MEKQIDTMKIAGKTFRIYKPLVSPIPYIIGVNVADRLGDDSTIVIAHPESMHIVAVYRSKLIGLEGLEKILYELVSEITPLATVCVVRNSTGLQLLDSILKRMFNRLTYYLYYEKHGKLVQYGVDVNKCHAIMDLNSLKTIDDITEDVILALSAATYVYNKKASNTTAEIPKDSNEGQINITLSKSMKEKLIEMSKHEGVTVEMLINQILTMEIARFGK